MKNLRSLWRSFHGIENHVTGSKTVHSISSNIYPVSTSLGRFPLEPNFSSCVRGTAANFLQQVTGYPKHHRFLLPLKCLPMAPLMEIKFQICRELAPSHIGISRSVTCRTNFSFRCITTVNHPDESVVEHSSVVTPDTVQPQRIKFKRLDKTAKNIMNILDKEAVDQLRADRELPDIRPGYIIQLKVEVPENKRRASILKGIVIARRNAGLNTTFRLRRLVAGVGVESVFPLYSPNIKEVKVLDKKKVRRAKLYYLRDRMNPLKK